MSIRDQIYTDLPDGMQDVARKWYYLLDPRVSWRERRKPREVDEAFFDRFFEDEAEYRRYEEEFFEGRVGEICAHAGQEVGDGYTIFDAHRKDCARIYSLVRKLEPEDMVETGVYSGVSTVSILLALAENGHGTLHSIDYSPYLDDEDAFVRERPSCSDPGSHQLEPGRDPGWIVPEDLHDRWDLRIGRSRDLLPDLYTELPEIDLFLHDSEHTTARMLFEFELAWEWLAPGGLLLSSHVEWNDAFDTFVEERDCDHGYASYHYLGYEGEYVSCGTGYAVRE